MRSARRARGRGLAAALAKGLGANGTPSSMPGPHRQAKRRRLRAQRRRPEVPTLGPAAVACQVPVR